MSRVFEGCVCVCLRENETELVSARLGVCVPQVLNVYGSAEVCACPWR